MIRWYASGFCFHCQIKIIYQPWSSDQVASYSGCLLPITLAIIACFPKYVCLFVQCDSQPNNQNWTRRRSCVLTRRYSSIWAEEVSGVTKIVAVWDVASDINHESWFRISCIILYKLALASTCIGPLEFDASCIKDLAPRNSSLQILEWWLLWNGIR